MSQFGQQQIGNASGLYNLMRNLGGSIGIAFVTTMLARGAQAHQALMVGHLTPTDPAFAQQLAAAKAVLAHQTDPVTATRQAYNAVYYAARPAGASVGVCGQFLFVRPAGARRHPADVPVQTGAICQEAGGGALKIHSCWKQRRCSRIENSPTSVKNTVAMINIKNLALTVAAQSLTLLHDFRLDPQDAAPAGYRRHGNAAAP